jgi:hypothetical protein
MCASHSVLNRPEGRSESESEVRSRLSSEALRSTGPRTSLNGDLGES